VFHLAFSSGLSGAGLSRTARVTGAHGYKSESKKGWERAGRDC
jgi:hypothetical protein